MTLGILEDLDVGDVVAAFAELLDQLVVALLLEGGGAVEVIVDPAVTFRRDEQPEDMQLGTLVGGGELDPGDNVNRLALCGGGKVVKSRYGIVIRHRERAQPRADRFIDQLRRSEGAVGVDGVGMQIAGFHSSDSFDIILWYNQPSPVVAKRQTGRAYKSVYKSV